MPQKGDKRDDKQVIRENLGKKNVKGKESGAEKPILERT